MGILYNIWQLKYFVQPDEPIVEDEEDDEDDEDDDEDDEETEG